MNKKLALILALFIVFWNFRVAEASLFQNAYLKLDSLTSNSSLAGTVCAKPSSAGAGTENKVVVTFPSDFTVSGNTSNWTTDTNNLPDGAVAWSGISANATGVSGKSVTFSSNDLTASNLYCFNFNGASSLTGNAGNDKTGTITTQNSSNSTIDSTTYAVSIISSNQISVTASVDPKVSDLQIDIQSQDSGSSFPQNTTLTYQITYGSYLAVTFPITIEAEWSQGTIQGDSSPSVEILDYVTSSATQGINNTSPVVDLINNKISWTFSSFPANSTDHTVTFSLKTNSSYNGTLPVNFTVSGRSIASSTVTPDSTVSQDYLYDESLNPTPTNTPTPTPTSVPAASTSTVTNTPTPTPTPTSVPEPTVVFNSVNVTSISKDQAGITVSTNPLTKMELVYGTSPQGLNQVVSFANLSQNNTFMLKNLRPETKYYFRISAKDQNGKITNSDIFTFTTANTELAAQIEENSIVVTSKNNVIFDTVSAFINPQNKESFIVIPQNTNFQFKFAFKKNQSIVKAKIIIRKRATSTLKAKILGLNTFANETQAATDNITLLEIKPGVYTATVRSPLEPGEYDLIISFLDTNGNLVEQQIANIKITNPFTVIKNNSTNDPIEGARVFLYIYNITSKTFVPLSSNNLDIPNPSFTNSSGIDDFVLPKGKYKAVITNLNYKEKTIIFSIEDSNQTNYPIVKLDSSRFDVINFFKYYITSFNDVFLVTTNAYVSYLQASIRFFDLVAALILFSFVSLTLFAFSKRHHIPMSSFISYFFYLLNHKQRNKIYISGVVFDQYKNSIPSANVYLIDSINEQIIQATKTNNKGEFFFKKQTGEYLLMIMKKGYKSIPQFKYSENTDASLKITMEKIDFKSSILDKTHHFLFTIISMSFESLILVSLFFEVILIPSFGIKTLPFLAISLFNIILWILHRKIKSA